MGWKKMLVGEKMPDKEDPKYRQRYEKEVKAGRKFAKTISLTYLPAKYNCLQMTTNGCSCPSSLDSLFSVLV